MISNRQGGRRRGRGGGGGRSPNMPGAGNRQDNRQRGNAAQLLEKYKGLARDAQVQGDRVQAEYFLQFADHYYRILNESRSRFEEQRRPRDDDYGDEEEDREEAAAESDEEEAVQRSSGREQEQRNGETRQRRQRGRRPKEDEGSDGEGERIAMDALPPAIGGNGTEPEAEKPRRRPRRSNPGEEVAPAA